MSSSSTLPSLLVSPQNSERQEEDQVEQKSGGNIEQFNNFLPLSISLAVSSSSLASNNYGVEETNNLIPSGPASSASGGSTNPHINNNTNNNSQKIPSQVSEVSMISSVDGSRNRVSPNNNHQMESDPAVLARRQKQIDYGKTTQEYANYLKAVPIAKRAICHPKTPPMHRKYSRRAWDGLIKRWRLNLHCWTYPEAQDLGDFDDNGNYFIGLQGLSTTTERKNNYPLNESFSSEATTATSGSSATSATTSSLPLPLPSIFPEFGYYSGYRNAAGSMNPREFKLFSPPSSRPSSSLCFSERRDEIPGTSSRQPWSSERDLNNFGITSHINNNNSFSGANSHSSSLHAGGGLVWWPNNIRSVEEIELRDQEKIHEKTVHDLIKLFLKN